MFVIIFAILLILLSEGVRLFFRWRISHHIGNKARPFERKDASLPFSLLILGDSTAYGTGVDNPTQSLGGKIGASFPHVAIWNRAKNALSLNDLPSTIDTIASEKGRFDGILIVIGGIDMLRLTPPSVARKKLLRTLRMAKKLSPHIVLALSSNIRSATFFRFPLNRIFEYEHRSLETLYGQIAQEEHIAYVSLYEPIDTCPFAKNPEKLYANDGLHPNHLGYEIWFEKIKEPLKKIFPSNIS